MKLLDGEAVLEMLFRWCSITDARSVISLPKFSILSSGESPLKKISRNRSTYWRGNLKNSNNSGIWKSFDWNWFWAQAVFYCEFARIFCLKSPKMRRLSRQILSGLGFSTSANESLHWSLEAFCCRTSVVVEEVLGSKTKRLFAFILLIKKQRFQTNQTSLLIGNQTKSHTGGFFGNSKWLQGGQNRIAMRLHAGYCQWALTVHLDAIKNVDLRCWFNHCTKNVGTALLPSLWRLEIHWCCSPSVL